MPAIRYAAMDVIVLHRLVSALIMQSERVYNTVRIGNNMVNTSSDA